MEFGSLSSSSKTLMDEKQGELDNLAGLSPSWPLLLLLLLLLPLLLLLVLSSPAAPGCYQVKPTFFLVPVPKVKLFV